MTEVFNNGDVTAVVLKGDSHPYAALIQKAEGGKPIELDYEPVQDVEGIQQRVNVPNMKLSTGSDKFGGIQLVFDTFKPIMYPKTVRRNPYE